MMRLNRPAAVMLTAATMSATFMGGLIGAAFAEVATLQPASSYSLIVSRAGQDYSEDFNLSLDDCRQAVDVAMGGDLPMNDGARCEAE